MHISDKIIRFLLLKIQILILFVLEKFICFIINLLKGIWEIFVIVRIDQNCKKLEETNILKKKRVEQKKRLMYWNNGLIAILKTLILIDQ